MFIKAIKLKNFKKFEELELSLNNKNFIEGKNGEGKSTIRDAIFFCFYGRTSDGSLSDSTKYIKDGKVKCLVEIEFEKDNQNYIVRRERTDNQTRITLLDGSQSEEDSVITQRELESIIPNYELMQNVFHIGYFMSLSDMEKREFLIKLTPEIDKKKIYFDLGGTQELLDKYCLENFESGIHNRLLKFNRENDSELTRLNVLIKNSIPIEIPKMEIEDPSDEFNKIKEEYKKYILLKNEWEMFNKDVETEKQNKEYNNNIQNEIDNITIKNIEKPSTLKLEALIKQKNGLQPTISIPENKCPTCLQEISIEHKNKVDAVNNIRLKNIAAVSEAIDSERKRISNDETTYAENEAKKRKIENLKNSFKNIKVPIAPAEKLTEFDVNKEKYIEEKYKKYQSEKSRIEILRQQENERMKNNTDMINSREIIIKKIEEINKLLPIFSNNGIPAKEIELKLDPIISEFKKLLPECRIELVEMLKNGLGTKEVFNIYYNDIEYAKMSTGEKIRVDIAISQIIDELSGRQVGVYFLDNSESIDEIPTIKEQYFIAKVNNKNLIIK